MGPEAIAALVLAGVSALASAFTGGYVAYTKLSYRETQQAEVLLIREEREGAVILTFKAKLANSESAEYEARAQAPAQQSATSPHPQATLMPLAPVVTSPAGEMMQLLPVMMEGGRDARMKEMQVIECALHTFKALASGDPFVPHTIQAAGIVDHIGDTCFGQV